MLEKLDHCEIDEADSIKHTAIVLIGCITCRMVYPFPAQNAALITERYLATIRADLARQGWTWVADNPEES
jgi:hypothetical protein